MSVGLASSLASSLALLVVGCFAEPGGPVGGALDASTGQPAASSSGGLDAPGSEESDGVDGDSSGPAPSSSTGGESSGASTGEPRDAMCPHSVTLLFDAVSQSEGIDELPTLVRLTPEVIDYTQTAADGADLRFVGADGETVLVHEVDTWRAGQESIVWVRVPRVDAENDRMELCYGGEARLGNPAETWDSDFVGVWHFSQDVFGRDAMLLDSTASAHDGFPTGTSVLQPQVATPLGRGLILEQGAETIEIPGDSTLDTPDAMTFEMVVRPTTLELSYQEVVNRDIIVSMRVLEANFDRPSVSISLDTPTNITMRADTTSVEDWMYVSGTYDQSDGIARTCVDGGACVEFAAGAGTLIVEDATVALEIGSADVIVDDVRISRVRRSQAWVEAVARGYAGTLLNVL